MPTPAGHLERALRELTIGAVQAGRAHDQLNRTMGATELDLQYQLEISGKADTVIALTTKSIDFEIDFFYAPGNRDSDLERPHMIFGGEADAPVALSATVVAWHEDPDSGAVTGADVAIGACAPTLTPFTGKVHITFQGWGLVRDTAETETAPS